MKEKEAEETERNQIWRGLIKIMCRGKLPALSKRRASGDRHGEGVKVETCSSGGCRSVDFLCFLVCGLLPWRNCMVFCFFIDGPDGKKCKTNLFMVGLGSEHDLN